MREIIVYLFDEIWYSKYNLMMPINTAWKRKYKHVAEYKLYDINYVESETCKCYYILLEDTYICGKSIENCKNWIVTEFKKVVMLQREWSHRGMNCIVKIYLFYFLPFK